MKCQGELGYTMPDPNSDALDQFDGLENDDAFMSREVKDDTKASDDQDDSSESDTQSDEKKESGKSEDEGTPKEGDSKTPAEGESKGTTEETKPEPVVPLHRFKQVVKENKQLRNQGGSAPKPSRELTEEEQKDSEVDNLIEKKVEKALSRREERQSEQDTQDAEELVELMDIYGDFDVDKVLDIKDEFKKVGTTLSNEGALKIFFDRQKNPTSRTAEPKPSDPKPKVPQPKSSAPVKDETKTPQVTGRPLRDVVEEAKKEYGLK